MSTMPVARAARGYGIKQVVRGELVKLASLRSTAWTLLVTLAGALLVTFLSTNSEGHHSRAYYQGFDPTNQALSGVALAMLSIGVLGVLTASGEYATGTIRTSLAAVPRRPLLLTGKIVVLAGVALVVGEVISFACFGLGQAILGGGGAPTAALGQPGVLRAVALSGAFLALVALIGLGLGTIIRHTAGAVAAYVGVTLLLPLLLRVVPSNPGRFAPGTILANSVATTLREPHAPSAPVGMLLMVLYSVVVLGAAAVLIVRRDA